MTREKYLQLLYAHKIELLHCIFGNFFYYNGQKYWTEDLV